jgi:hypothetical protein
MNSKDIVASLTKMSPWELVDLLNEVFDKTDPYPGEGSNFRKFVLCTVSAYDTENWTDITRDVTASPDRQKYPDGVHCVPYEFGTCTCCQSDICSPGKNAICPICGNAVYCT